VVLASASREERIAYLNPCLNGDINDDNEVNILDIIKSLRVAMSIEPPPTTALGWCRCDLDRNNKLNVLDAIKVLRIVAGIEQGQQQQEEQEQEEQEIGDVLPGQEEELEMVGQEQEIYP
jgi:hypothetical protein